MKTRHYLAILLLVLTGLLSACGQKGPLYMPDQPEQPEQVSQQEHEEDKEE